MLKRVLAALAAVAAGCGFAGAALADKPGPWQIGFQKSASPLMDDVHSFHGLLLWIIIAITLFVLALLLYAMVRFRESKNPTPSKTTHNTLIEVVWTLVPVMILVVIAIPSFKLLYKSDKTVDATITIKARGHQWYWSYVYEQSLKTDDQGKVITTGTGDDAKAEDLMSAGRFSFSSRIACRTQKECQDKAKDGKVPLRLLDVDNAIVVPVNTKVRLLVTGMDVIHSWAMPSMGVKVDAVPGRYNQTWIYARKPGMYYGQCSELCGADHGFMPIAVRAVTKAEYEAWVKAAQASAKAGNGPFEAVEDPKPTASNTSGIKTAAH